MNRVNWLEKMFVVAFASSFLALCYLIFFDVQKKTQNTNRIILKMQTVQDLIVDLRDLSKTLQIKNVVENLQACHPTDIEFVESSFKLSMISEIIEIKGQLMAEAVNQAIDEINKPVTYRVI